MPQVSIEENGMRRGAKDVRDNKLDIARVQAGKCKSRIVSGTFVALPFCPVKTRPARLRRSRMHFRHGP